MEKPRYTLTFVTVVRNDPEGLRQTLNSIERVKGRSCEVVVVDGASTDDTLNVLDTVSLRNLRVISEPDSGPYDAMNKGVKSAQGIYAMFLNAGDSLNLRDFPLRLMEFANSDVDVVYGDVTLRSNEGSRNVKARGFDRIRAGMPCSHQSVAIRTSLLRDNPFDTEYTVAADYAQLLDIATMARRTVYLDKVISIVAMGGLSDQERILGIRERRAILARAGLLDPRTRLRLQSEYLIEKAKDAATKVIGAGTRARIAGYS
jgi:glycosyltransferase involved in cell wall biosynthesis